MCPKAGWIPPGMRAGENAPRTNTRGCNNKDKKNSRDASRPFMFHYQLSGGLLPHAVFNRLGPSQTVASLRNGCKLSPAAAIRRKSSASAKKLRLPRPETPFPFPWYLRDSICPITGFRKRVTASREGARESQTPKPANSGRSGPRSKPHSPRARVSEPLFSGLKKTPAS